MRKELTNMSQNPNNIFILMKFMKKDGNVVEGGRCMRGKDRKLGFSEKNMKKSRKGGHMK